MTSKLVDAVDLLDWDYLCEIAELVERPKTWAEGAMRFAYFFTSTSEIAHQNTMLVDLIKNATTGHTADRNEQVIEVLADTFKCDKNALRQYAKDAGVKLKRWKLI